MKRKRYVKVYISVGSHGRPFMFDFGDVGTKYPTLLWVFKKRITMDLIPAKLVYELDDK